MKVVVGFSVDEEIAEKIENISKKTLIPKSTIGGIAIKLLLKELEYGNDILYREIELNELNDKEVKN